MGSDDGGVPFGAVGAALASPWVWPALALLVLVGATLVLLREWKRSRLALSFVVVTIAFAVCWAIAYAALRSNHHQAAAYVDCWPACTDYRYAVASTYWYGPIVFAFLTAFAATLALPLAAVISSLIVWQAMSIGFALRWWADGLGDARPEFGIALGTAAAAGVAAAFLARRAVQPRRRPVAHSDLC